MDYSIQIERIKQKLKEAAKVDQNLKVFGASSHKYKIGNTAEVKDVEIFEKKYNIKLPDAYKAFLLDIADGGFGYMKQAAGPYYGIFPLEESVINYSFLNQPEVYLQKQAMSFSELTLDCWNVLTAEVHEEEENKSFDDSFYDPDVEDEDEIYDRVTNNLYSGLLVIGHQGCSNYQGLVLNGKDVGKVIYLNSELYMPSLTYDNNFLDWYEGWLDGIIEGYLCSSIVTNFGNYVNGNEYELLSKYEASTDQGYRKACLIGLKNRMSTTPDIIKKVQSFYEETTDYFEKYFLTLFLAKFDFENADYYLRNILAINPEDFLRILNYSTSTKNAFHYSAEISHIMSTTHNYDTFLVGGWLLEKFYKEFNFKYNFIIEPRLVDSNERIVGQTKRLMTILDKKEDNLYNCLQSFSEQELIDFFKKTPPGEKSREWSVMALFSRDKVSSATIDAFKEVYNTATPVEKGQITKLITIFDYKNAESYLNELKLNLPYFFLWILLENTPDKGANRIEEVIEIIESTDDLSAFIHAFNILDNFRKEQKISISKYLEYALRSTNKEISDKAWNLLGQQSDKANYTVEFLKALESDDPDKVSSALYILVPDKENLLVSFDVLKPYLLDIYRRFPKFWALKRYLNIMEKTLSDIKS